MTRKDRIIIGLFATIFLIILTLSTLMFLYGRPLVVKSEIKEPVWNDRILANEHELIVFIDKSKIQEYISSQEKYYSLKSISTGHGSYEYVLVLIPKKSKNE